MSSGAKSEYISNVDEIVNNIDKAKYEKLLAASEFARNRLIEKLSGNRSGREYTVPGTSTTYTASAPGEAPASRTGQLRGSIEYEITRDNTYIGTPLEYGLYLEKGSYNPVTGAILYPRPWLKTTLSENQKAIQNILGSEWF